MWKFSFSLTLLFSFSLYFVQAAEYGCPEDTEIAPCHCTSYILDCSEVTSEDELQQALDADFPFDYIYRFQIIRNNYISGFTKNVFGNLTFTSVKISASAVSFIDDSFFDNLHDSLQILAITKGKMDNNGFPFGILPSLKTLTTLYLLQNQFTFLPPILAPLLTFLDLHDNAITSVDKDAFQTCTNINYIALDYNLIRDLDLYLFKGLFNLQTLYLDHNQITRFQSGQFNLMTELQVLQIGYNPATEIDKAVFVSLPKLITLNMDDLKFESLRVDMFFNVPSLSTWSMDYGELDKINYNVFTQFSMLTDLQLSHNYLKTIKSGRFRGFTGVGTIHLSYNDISTIRCAAFPDLESSALYLDNNKIETLDATWLQPIFDQQNSVSVDYNPLTCGCDLAWIFDNAAYLDQFLGSPTCSDGTFIKDLNQDYFTARNCI